MTSEFRMLSMGKPDARGRRAIMVLVDDRSVWILFSAHGAIARDLVAGRSMTLDREDMWERWGALRLEPSGEVGGGPWAPALDEFLSVAIGPRGFRDPPAPDP